MSKFIAYVDLTDSREISPKYSEDNEKQKCVGKFLFPKYFSRSVQLRITSYLFLDNQSKYRKSPTHLKGKYGLEKFYLY